MIMWMVQTIATSSVAVLLSLLAVRQQARPRADAHAPQVRAGLSAFALACISGIAVAAAAGLYASARDTAAAAPPSSAAPASAPLAEEAPAVQRLAELTRTFSSEGPLAAPAEPQSGLPSVEEMIQRLAARMEKRPDDRAGWRTLGWSYLNVGRFAEAADTYAKAIALDPGTVELRTARVEAMIQAANGTVTANARDAIEETLRIDPQNTRARFFRAMAKEQQGERAAALADWVGLVKEVKPDEPWLPELKSRISKLESSLGADLPGVAAGAPGQSR